MLTMYLPSLSRRALPAVVAALVASSYAQSGDAHITIQVDKPGITISPTFYGLMTEEINHSYDGGLYGELLQNRSFRDSNTTIPHWSVATTGSGAGTIALNSDGIGKPPLGVSLRLDVTSADSANTVGIANDGYWGIPVRPHTTFRASFYAMAAPGATQPLTVSIAGVKDGKVFASAVSNALTSAWKKYTVTLRTGNAVPSATNRFVISAIHPGTIWFHDVSLFPPTFKNRPNGNRIDLMKMLGEMKPSFLRLPGGNYLEGDTIADRFEWKDTLGDPSDRMGHQGPWRYRSSDGLGLLEFLEWCEDLHMQPLLAVYAGYSLRGAYAKPGPDLEPYVQDALDEIEYVTGSPKTKWGAVRAKNGHPRPFPLAYVEIGNEDQFDRSGSYDGRYAQFYDAIKAKYPKLQLIATTPVKLRKPDLIDDHYYRSATEMARDSGHYDRYDRKGPKIFVGEWASIGGNPTPTFNEALGDAAWLTGLERNSDVVVMESYAPLMVNVNPRGSQWPTNLIGYDALTSFGSPSYYVQSLFAKYTGDTILPAAVKLAKVPSVDLPVPHGSIGVGTWVTDSEYKDVEVKVDGKTAYQKDFTAGLDDWTRRAGTWRVEDGSLRQSGLGQDTQATAGDSKWTDYTYHVKAKKLGGQEGFLILFHVQNRRNYLQWNIGGWQNTRSAIQRHEDGELDEIGEATDTTIEAGRWYDIRIELRGAEIKCYLDNKLITAVTVRAKPLPAALYVSSSIVNASGDLYLKIVNVSGEALSTQVDLAGAVGFESSANGWVLTGNREVANTVAEPVKVAPKPVKVRVSDSSMKHEFPAYSITVLKIERSR